jgi:GTP-binding protein EngB required for normal cell division
MVWARHVASLVAAISCFIVPSLSQTCPAGEVCTVDESTGVNYLIIGNPGTGKSTILNGFAGKALFKSGPAFGMGNTKALQKETVNGNTFMDTPGLADIQMRETAAQEIEKALKVGGTYKIFFLITLEAGRVRPEDRTTIELILMSAPITHYGIIINKLEDDVIETLKKNEDGALYQVWTDMMNGLPAKTLYFHFEPRQEALAGKKNMVPPLDQELIRFIQMVPAIDINPGEVKPIKTEEFEALTEKFEMVIKELREDKAALEAKMKQERDDYDKLIEQMVARQQELLKQYNQRKSSGGGIGDVLDGIGDAIDQVGDVVNKAGDVADKVAGLVTGIAGAYEQVAPAFTGVMNIFGGCDEHLQWCDE